MYSRHHAIVSAAVTAIVAPLVAPVSAFGYAVPTIAIVAYGTAVGVLVDLDHLLLSRVRTGDWRTVRYCLSNPVAALFDQRDLFEPGDVGLLTRLLSHLLLVGVVVPLHLFASTGLGIVVAVVLYVHVLTDVAWDVDRLDGTVDVTRDGRLAVADGRRLTADERSGSGPDERIGSESGERDGP